MDEYSLSIILSVSAILIAALALGWQVAAHLLTGPRAKLGFSFSLPVGGIDHLPNSATLTVRNVGRMPVTVTNLGIRLPDGKTAAISLELVPELSKPLPHRVEPFDEASWSVPVDALDRVKRSYPHPEAWRYYVTLGSGKKLESKGSYR